MSLIKRIDLKLFNGDGSYLGISWKRNYDYFFEKVLGDKGIGKSK